MSLFTYDRILYAENPKDSTKKPHRTNKFSKVADHEVSTDKISYALYANSAQARNEIKKTTSFTIESERIKLVGISQEGERYV